MIRINLVAVERKAARRKFSFDISHQITAVAGLVLLVGVMIFAFWNDIERIFLR